MASLIQNIELPECFHPVTDIYYIHVSILLDPTTNVALGKEVTMSSVWGPGPQDHCCNSTFAVDGNETTVARNTPRGQSLSVYRSGEMV